MPRISGRALRGDDRMISKCKRAIDVEVGNMKYKVVDLKDPYAPIHRVLAKHECVTVISPETYNALKQKAV
jgi:hypothetical protein